MPDLHASKEEWNEWLKSKHPKFYKEGWRKGDFAWSPTKKIADTYAQKKTVCNRCEQDDFHLKGLGMNLKPHWVCDNCGNPYLAHKK